MMPQVEPSVPLNGEEDEKSRQEGLGRFFHLFPKFFAYRNIDTPEQLMSIPVARGESLRGKSQAIPWKRAAAAESAVTILVVSEDESVCRTLCDLLNGYH